MTRSLEAQFTEQANAICVDGDAKIGEVLGPIFSGEPTPDELQVALDAIISTSRETSDSLASLAPPSDMSDDVDDMITAFNAANDEAEAQGLGFFENDGDPWAPVGVIAARARTRRLRQWLTIFSESINRRLCRSCKISR